MFAVFPGCTLEKYSDDLKKPLVKVLECLGIEWIDLGGRCCGMPLLLSGDVDGFKEVVKSNTDHFKNVSVIITSCAGCFRVFKEYYSGYMVKHLSQFILDLGISSFPRSVNLRAIYHDPCELIRCGVFEEPRELLRRIPGLSLSEFRLNKESSTCCGGGGLVKAVFPSLAVEVAYEKILRELPQDVDTIVSSCPFCYLNFKDASSIYNLKIRVYDIIHVLGMALGVL
jgi:Fe-S oxidoreductase